MPNFTESERNVIRSIIASLSIKRIPDPEIIKEVYNQTGKTISLKTLYNARQQIKRDSYHWYETLRKDNFEYIYQFKERINEIIDLQNKHHKIIKDNEHNPSIQQTSLAELHKLNITLSNYFDVAPSLIPTREIDKYTLSTTQENKEIIV